MVLIIDDDQDLRTVLVELLRAEGIPTEGSGPFDALEQLRVREPEVVLLDVMMPGLDGYAILRYIRSDHRLRNVFVVMLSAKSQVPEIEAGLEHGADDYVGKPFALDELLARVRIGLRASARIFRANDAPPNPSRAVG